MRSGAMWTAVALVLASGSWAQAANPSLTKAEALLDKHQYRPAEKALTQALKATGNDRATLIKIFELQGLVAAFLNQPAKAEGFFRALLELDPEHSLGRDYAPRVTKPFQDAQVWLGKHAPLQLAEAKAPAPPAVQVSADPLKLAKKVRFHLRNGTAPYKMKTVRLAAGKGKTDAKGVDQWWADLLGDHDAVLARVGSPDQPIAVKGKEPELEPAPLVAQAPQPAAGDLLEPLVAAAPAPKASPTPPAAATPPAPTPAPAPVHELPMPPPPKVAARPAAPPPAVSTVEAQQTRESSSILRPVGYGFLAAAVASGAVGAVLGLQAQSARNQITGASQDSQGIVIGMSQPQAYQLDSKVHTDATVANVLFGASAACAVTGALLWGFGGSTRVVPSAGGVAVVGSLP